MGTRAAIKNAIMLLMEVSATLVPVRRKQSPVRSFKKKHKKADNVQRGGEEKRGEEIKGKDVLKVP